jgi:hypothetical protein
MGSKIKRASGDALYRINRIDNLKKRQVCGLDIKGDPTAQTPLRM